MRKLVIIFSLFTLFILTGCGSTAQEIDTPKSIPVEIIDVEEAAVSKTVYRSGILSAQNEAKLSFKVGGFVKQLAVDEGQFVSKGDVLASLDLSEINAQVRQAQSAYDKAARDLERVERLFADSVATLEQRQNSTTAFDVARANLQIARFNQKHAKISAPSDGRILKRFVVENELVSPGLPVFYFAPRDKNWIIRVGVSETELLSLQLGDSAKVSFDAYSDAIFPAYISEIAASIDPQSGAYEIELTLESTPYTLISGFVGMVKITPSIKQNVIMIPVEALIEADKDTGYVYSWSADRRQIKKVPVQIYAIFKNSIAVLSGLEQVDQVIGKGAAYVTERASITEIN